MRNFPLCQWIKRIGDNNQQQWRTGAGGERTAAVRSFSGKRKDPRVDLLVKKQASINTVSKKSIGRTMRGYRLMILNTNKREDAIAAKTKVYTYFPELKAYLTYQAPFFRLKAGNFKTRDEAEKYKKEMAPLFPKGVFILNDTIEVKGEKTEEEG